MVPSTEIDNTGERGVCVHVCVCVKKIEIGRLGHPTTGIPGLRAGGQRGDEGDQEGRARGVTRGSSWKPR